MKILCPFHEDTTPSMHLYETQGYCFVCGGIMPLDGSVYEGVEVVPEEPEDVQAELLRISNLPHVKVRELSFTGDDRGFYITWPSQDYYKYRLYSDNPRYLGPRGHKPPLYVEPTDHKDTLLVVEGEINARSIHKAIDGSALIVSPGAASNFGKHAEEIKGLAEKAKEVLIWTDMDPAGIRASWDLYRVLRGVSRISIVDSVKDANDLLVEDGVQAIRDVLNAAEGV